MESICYRVFYETPLKELEEDLDRLRKVLKKEKAELDAAYKKLDEEHKELEAARAKAEAAGAELEGNGPDSRQGEKQAIDKDPRDQGGYLSPGVPRDPPFRAPNA